MIHPKCRIIQEHEPLADALTPVYPTTAGLSSGFIRKLVHNALKQVSDGDDQGFLAETLPDAVLKKIGTPRFQEEQDIFFASAVAGCASGFAGAAQPSSLAPDQVR